MKKNVRNNKKVKRNSFKRITQKNRRIKSNKPRKASSTKISSNSSFMARATTVLRRILPLKH